MQPVVSIILTLIFHPLNTQRIHIICIGCKVTTNNWEKQINLKIYKKHTEYNKEKTINPYCSEHP